MIIRHPIRHWFSARPGRGSDKKEQDEIQRVVSVSARGQATMIRGFARNSASRLPDLGRRGVAGRTAGPRSRRVGAEAEGRQRILRGGVVLVDVVRQFPVVPSVDRRLPPVRGCPRVLVIVPYRCVVRNRSSVSILPTEGFCNLQGDENYNIIELMTRISHGF